MKQLIIAAMLLLPANSAVLAGDGVNLCSTTAKLAASIMRNRQLGVSLEEALGVAGSSTEPAKSFITSIVMAAYEIPRYSSERYIERAVEEFRDDAHLTCLKGTKPPS